MAKITLGNFKISGKVGALVYCAGKQRKPYVRRMPSVRPKRPATAAQLGWREIMKKTTHLLNPLRDLIAECWTEKLAQNMIPLHAAFKHLTKHAIEGVYPDIRFRYDKIKLSKGLLSPPDKGHMQVRDNEVHVTWDTLRGFGFSDDQAFIVIISEELQTSLIFRYKAKRADGEVILQLPPAMVKGNLHGYLIFISKDKKKASDTLYLERRY